MLGLDVIGADHALGVSWGDVGDVGKAAFPYVHATGKGIASAFGAGAAAQALENVEQGQGWLPPSTASTTSVEATVEKTTKAIAPKSKGRAADGVPKAPQPQSKARAAVTPSADVKLPTPQSNHTALIVVGSISVFGLLVLLFRGSH